MLLCSSVEAVPCILELSLHLCYSKAAKIGIKTQTSAARSRLMVMINLAGSVGERRWQPSLIACQGKRSPITLH